MLSVPLRYIPRSLTKRDQKKQAQQLRKSRKLYKKQKYFTRKPLASYKHKPSNHIINAKRIYNISKIGPSPAFAKATGCSVNTLKRIIQKGEGAYFSSGSRPNQTAQSWGLARLASAVTGGKASAVDFNLLATGCNHTKKAYKLAKRSGSRANITRKALHRVPKKIIKR